MSKIYTKKEYENAINYLKYLRKVYSQKQGEFPFNFKEMLKYYDITIDSIEYSKNSHYKDED